MGAVKRDAFEWSRRQQSLETPLYGFRELLLECLPRGGMLCRIAQSFGDTADKARIFPADIDLDPNEALRRFSGAVAG